MLEASDGVEDGILLGKPEGLKEGVSVEASVGALEG
jgi:hypothetical protein